MRTDRRFVINLVFAAEEAAVAYLRGDYLTALRIVEAVDREVYPRDAATVDLNGLFWQSFDHSLSLLGR